MQAKTELLMETLSNVPNEHILILFADARNSFEHLPNDNEILSYYRRSPKYIVKTEEKKTLPNVGQDIGHMRKMSKKYTHFKEFLDLAEKEPNNPPPRDVHKWFCKAMMNPKNFKEKV